MGLSTDIMTIYGWMAGPDEAPRGAVKDGCDYWYRQFPLDEEGHVILDHKSTPFDPEDLVHTTNSLVGWGDVPWYFDIPIESHDEYDAMSSPDACELAAMAQATKAAYPPKAMRELFIWVMRRAPLPWEEPKVLTYSWVG